MRPARASASNVRGGSSANAVEQRARPEAADHGPGACLVQGRQGQPPVGKELDQDPAGGHHDQGPELLVVDQPKCISTPGGDIGSHEHLRARAARDRSAYAASRRSASAMPRTTPPDSDL